MSRMQRAIVCRLGVAGVAIATDISTIWSAVCVLGILTKEEEEFRLHLRKIRIHNQPICGISGFMGCHISSDVGGIFCD